MMRTPLSGDRNGDAVEVAGVNVTEALISATERT
jgi:hypothetical protein